jgi:DNA repair protein RadC
MTRTRETSTAQLFSTRYQPREKLIKLGVKNLTEIELISLLLGSGDAYHPLPALAQATWKAIQNHPVTHSHHWLTHIAGLGLAKACTIYAALELGQRLQSTAQHTKVTKPEIAFQLASAIRQKSKEYALALYLDGQQQLIESQIIAIGGHNFAFLSPVEIFHPALKLPAASLILVHNHPSGRAEPSEDDLVLTHRLTQAGELLGIALTDHLVVTSTNFYSFREHGLLTTTPFESHQVDP